MTTTQINRRTGRREVQLRPEPATTGRTAATPCPPRLYPLVWYAREACAAALETGHDQPVPGHSMPSHVVSFPLRFSGWHVTTYGGRVFIGVKSILEHEIERDERLVRDRGEAWKTAREMRPEHVDPEAWEAEIVAAMKEHEEAEDVLAALERSSSDESPTYIAMTVADDRHLADRIPIARIGDVELTFASPPNSFLRGCRIVVGNTEVIVEPGTTVEDAAERLQAELTAAAERGEVFSAPPGTRVELMEATWSAARS